MTIFAHFLYSKEYKKTNLFINQNQQVMKKLLTIFMLCFAVFVANAQQVFLLQESFDDSTLPSGWNVVDADGDGFNWTPAVTVGNFNIHSGESCIVSASYDDTEGALTPDNWLISPALIIPANAQDVTLSWWVRGQDPSYAVEHYAVYVSTTGAAVSNFSNPAVYEGNSTEEYVNLTVDLTSYAGQTVYIGFRHYNVSDMFYLNLDDIEVAYSDPTIANAPANFTVTPDPNYGLSAELAWTNPATTVGGVALATITSIELYRGTTLVNSFSNPTVGAAMTYTDNAIPAAGQYTYTVYAVTTAGNGLAATQTVLVGNLCPITLTMTDSYGDGWNGNAIEIYDANNTLIGSYTIASGASATEEVMLAPGTYTFVWVVGSYPSECSFTITNAFDIEVFAGAGSSLSAGTFLTLNHSCSAPANAPTDFTVVPDPNQGLSADLSWTNPTTSYVGDALTAILSIELYRDTTLVNSFANPAVGAAMTYTDNTIPVDAIYTYSVYAVTDAGDGLVATQTALIGNVCPVILDMVDSWGDGWNGAAIEIYDADSTLIGSYTVPSSSTNATENVYLAPGTYTFVWVAGSYDSECSFTITNSFGIPLYTGSSMSAGTFYTLNHSCEPPAMYTVSGVVTSSVDNTPIANATVTVSGMNGGTVITTATGAYTMDSIVSILPYSITVEADGFNGAAASFEGLSGDTTINFSLTAPQFAVSYQGPIEVITSYGLDAQFAPITVSNGGNGTLTWGTSVDFLEVVRTANSQKNYTFNEIRRAKNVAAKNTAVRTATNAVATTLPGIEVSPMNTTIEGAPSRAAWDLLSSMDLNASGEQGIATDGNFIYTCFWNSAGQFGKYDMDGNFIETFTIANVGGIRDLTYDGTYFYGGASSSDLYQLDLANQTLVSTITTQVTTIRHCSYDAQNDGFWIGNWTDLYLVDRSGNIVVTGPTLSDAYGSAYDPYTAGGPFLWIFTQAQDANSQCVFVQYDINANALTNTTVDISTIDSGVDASDAMAGGAFATDVLVSGKFVMMANSQQQPNHVSIFELADAGWLSVTPGSGTIAPNQSTDLTLNFNGSYPVGDYNANLTITSRNPFVGDTVIPVIFHIVAPDCDAPTNLQVVPTDYEYMALTWDAPADVTGLVEYRIYRNNSSNYLTSTTNSYEDHVPAGHYCYYVKAYYENEGEQCLSYSTDTVCDDLLRCHPDSMCSIRISMVDSYGDGWNGASIQLSSNGEVLASFTCDASENDVYYDVCPGELTFTWIAGSYDSECSFMIYNHQNEVAYDGSTAPGSGVFLTYNHNCAAPVISVEEAEKDNTVSIYPNPASTMLNVHAENYSNVQIINFLGQVVYSANITENDFQINVSNLSNGVYFIRLNGETTTTQKFIKK